MIVHRRQRFCIKSGQAAVEREFQEEVKRGAARPEKRPGTSWEERDEPAPAEDETNACALVGDVNIGDSLPPFFDACFTRRRSSVQL